MNFDSKCERVVVQVLGAFETEHSSPFVKSMISHPVWEVSCSASGSVLF